jgi:hypothetical protein
LRNEENDFGCEGAIFVIGQRGLEGQNAKKIETN